MLEESKENKKLLTKILFAAYLLILFWIVVMKLQFTMEGYYRSRSLNLIPFGDSALINGRISLSEIGLNILIFVPYGIYMAMLKDDWSFKNQILPIFLTSLSFEIIQYTFAIGASDVTDIIGNTLGGIIGIQIYYTANKLVKSQTKVNKLVNALASLVTVNFIVLIGLLVWVNS